MDAYGLCFTDHINLYFIKLSQIVLVNIPYNLEVKNTDHISLVPIPEDLKMSGFVLVVFGA